MYVSRYVDFCTLVYVTCLYLCTFSTCLPTSSGLSAFYSFPGSAVLLCFSRLRSTQWVIGGACFIWLVWMLLLPEVLPS